MSTAPDSISLRPPTRYDAESSQGPTGDDGPSPEFLHRTWTVTHSTLSMWRAARNVRITYRPLPPSSPGGPARIDDLVEYEASSGKGGVKSVAGVDTATNQSPTNTSWDWRGKGLLFFVTSHWEVLGWGERRLQTLEGDRPVVERWAVTWFAPTLFTAEGIDVYCDRPEGLTSETEALIMAALRGIGVEKLVGLVDRDMKPVEISLPWKTK